MTVKQRQHLLGYLGYYVGEVDGKWGSGSREACKAFQRDFFQDEEKVDGVCGSETDKALTHAVAYGMPARQADQDTEASGDSWDGIEFFEPEEVRCKCGGKYCNGYPHAVQPLLMQIADRARRWSGHPIVIVSGLRCDTWNRLQGGVENSQHKYGEALDVYFQGKDPDTALAWLQSQPDVRYAYRISGCDNIHFDIAKGDR